MRAIRGWRHTALGLAASVGIVSCAQSDTSSDDAVDADVDDGSLVADGDPTLPGGVVVPFIEFSDATVRDRPVFGEKDTSLIDDGFVRAGDDEGFCTALDIVNARPQPDGDVEEIRFVDGYIRAVRSLVPDEISSEIDTVLMWTASVIDAGVFTEEAETAMETTVAAAVATVDDFVDERCNGL